MRGWRSSRRSWNPVENYPFLALNCLQQVACGRRTKWMGWGGVPVAAVIDMRTQFMCLTKHPLGFMNWQCVTAMSRCRAKQQQPNKPIISSFEIQFSGACTICLEPNSVAVSYFLQQRSRKEDSQGSKQVKNGEESSRGTNLDAC